MGGNLWGGLLRSGLRALIRVCRLNRLQCLKGESLQAERAFQLMADPRCVDVKKLAALGAGSLHKKKPSKSDVIGR